MFGLSFPELGNHHPVANGGEEDIVVLLVMNDGSSVSDQPALPM